MLNRRASWGRALSVALAAAALGLGTAATAAPASSVRAQHLHVRPGGGMEPLRVYVEQTGEGRPIVLLHGLGGSGYAWRRIVPDLAKSHRVITIDLMGFGRSDKPLHTRYSPFDHARVVTAALRRLDVRDAVLAGHSLGGLVAVLIALDLDRRDPGRVTQLALFNAPTLPQPVSGAVSFLRQPLVPYLALSVIPPETAAEIGLLSGAKRMHHITARDIAFYADPLRASGGVHAVIQSARQIEPANPRPILASYTKLRTPTLVAGCREDRTVPISTAFGMAKRLLNAKLAVLDGCDHLPMEQNPRAIVKALQAFLAPAPQPLAAPPSAVESGVTPAPNAPPAEEPPALRPPEDPSDAIAERPRPAGNIKSAGL